MTCNCTLNDDLKLKRTNRNILHGKTIQKINIDEANYCCLRSLVHDTIRNNKQENYFVGILSFRLLMGYFGLNWLVQNVFFDNVYKGMQKLRHFQFAELLKLLKEVVR